MKNALKALEAIEVLTGSDFGLDMECLLYMPKRQMTKKKYKEMLETAARIITDIYTISHAENSKCKHEDWENKKYEIIKSINLS